ncbi:tetratricopeptide repeat protein [Flavobacterium succinicans]|uniref:Tetratricopeptide repeat protein n=1 Tax=Flavobacterium succinicans TaxID=29536 RepID=A0A199XPY2_9FLAO|nr:tetratricopeptide repeat protein [Flavobacterium succinicans]OAZ03477.1 tetratricopeptide repeat protein [Flavobacterium succinicans]
MKNIVYLLLFITSVLTAQNGFEAGNALYKKGQYEQAIQAYESVVQTEKKVSADLYFNLGNCYYKLNQVAPAIYNYEKALVLKPHDNEIQNNLKFAQKRTIDEIKVVPKVGFEKLVHDFTSFFHYDTWGWIAIGFALLFLLFFLGYYFGQTSVAKRVFFFGMFFWLLLVLISVFAGYFEQSHFKNDRPAILFAESTEVKSEPQAASLTVIILHEGTKVYVLERLEQWRKVQLTDGTEGWLNANSIKEVK